MPVNEQSNIGFIIAVFVLLTATAFLVPAIFTAQNTPKTSVFEQSENERIVLTTSLEAFVDTIDSGGNAQINVTVIDTDTGVTNATVIAAGDTETLALSGEQINVTASEILSSTEAIVTYQYPLYFGWPDGVKSMVENMNTLVLVLLALIIGSFLYIREESKNG